MKRIIVLFMMIILSVVLVGCNKNLGKLYTLEEAYDLNLITKDDLKSIAYYFNKVESSDFVPKPKNPESISKRNERLIKKTYLRDVLKEPRLSIKKVHIYEYYGTYNGCIALGITDSYNCYDYHIYEEYVIGGVSFYNFHVAEIRIYTSNRSKK